MHAVLAWSALVLLTGPLAAQEKPGKAPKSRAGEGGAEAPAETPVATGPRKWKPLFDYTNLQPTHEEFWAPLDVAKVSLEQALLVADESEEAAIHPYKARIEVRDGAPVWHIELFVGEQGTAKPGRLNLQVSASEPKVVKRVELLTLAPDEERLWNAFKEVKVPLLNAVELAKSKVIGQKGDKQIVPDPRARTAEFVTEGAFWDIEVMGFEDKVSELRRYDVHVSGEKPVAKQKIMLDRFVGEPLRAAEPVALPNGMFLHDFIAGDGQEVKADSKVRVNYRLFLLDSTKIHDTWETKRDETFLVSQAPLKGMSEGMVGMRVGGKRKIAMPYGLAFGEAGNEISPRKAMVVCDVFIEEIVEE